MTTTEKPGDIVWLHLQDEVPALGSGRRAIRIVKIGWKWISIRGASAPSTTSNTRIPRKVWDTLARRIPVCDPKETVT